MRAIYLALAVAGAAVPAVAIAQTAPAPAAPAAAAKYSTEETEIGTLLDDPAAKAILDKHVPGLSSNEQVDMARAMTLKDMQQYAPDTLTDSVLAKVNADLAAIPQKK